MGIEGSDNDVFTVQPQTAFIRKIKGAAPAVEKNPIMTPLATF